MITPRRVRKGEQITAELFNLVVDSIVERTPIAGPNLRGKKTPRGIIFSADAVVGGRAVAGTSPTPWQITVEGNPDDGYEASVRPGSINSLVPDNTFDTFALSSGLNYVIARASTDGKNVTALTLLTDSTPPDGMTSEENSTPASFDDVIGMVVQTADGDTVTNNIYQVRSTNLTATPVIDFLQSRIPPGPGQEPFVRWWKWSVS